MSELEPRKRPRKNVVPRHIPQAVVPVPIGEVHDFVREALRGTSIMDPLANAISGWSFFAPRVRFTAIDQTHTRIEFDAVGDKVSETLLFAQRRGEIDQFFVALEDELDRRNRWGSTPPPGAKPIES